MCSGERSSSANGAIALRQSAACCVVDLQQQRLVALDDQGSVVHRASLRTGVPTADVHRSGFRRGEGRPLARRATATDRDVHAGVGVRTHQPVHRSREGAARPGAPVVFAAEASWAGRLEPFGFVEAAGRPRRARPGRRARARPASSGSTSSTRPRRSSPSRPATSSRPSSSPTYAGADRRRAVLPSRGCGRSSPSTGPTWSSRTTWCRSRR